MKHKIAPSLLAADFLNLQKEVEMINNSEADWLHMDIMDGVFVPNISFGFPVLDARSWIISSSRLIGVCGFKVTPAFIPASFIAPIVRCKWVQAS